MIQVHFLLEWMRSLAINFMEIQCARYFPAHRSKELEKQRNRQVPRTLLCFTRFNNLAAPLQSYIPIPGSLFFLSFLTLLLQQAIELCIPHQDLKKARMTRYRTHSFQWGSKSAASTSPYRYISLLFLSINQYSKIQLYLALKKPVDAGPQLQIHSWSKNKMWKPQEELKPEASVARHYCLPAALDYFSPATTGTCY